MLQWRSARTAVRDRLREGSCVMVPECCSGGPPEQLYGTGEGKDHVSWCLNAEVEVRPNSSTGQVKGRIVCHGA